MNRNRLFIISTLLIILLMSVSAISAQGPGDGDKPQLPVGGDLVEGALVQEAAQATETTPREVIAARRDGQSIADYIIEHGGDPDAVALAVKTNIEERANQALVDENITQERFDAVMENLDQVIADGMSATGPIVQPRNNNPRGGNQGQNGQNPNGSRPTIDPATLEILTEATGLEVDEIMTQLRDGQTLSEIITANSGDVEAVKAQIVENLTTGITERVNNMFDMPFNFDAPRPNNRPGGQERPFNLNIHEVIAEATGLDLETFGAALREGKTPAEIISENGGDVEAVKAQIITNVTEQINTAVANENLTQENADRILENLDERIDNVLNNPLQLRGRNGRGLDDSNGANQGVLE